MTSNHVKTSLLGNYKINDVKVDIYFSPEVIEAYASNDEINLVNSLKNGEEYDRDPLEKHFDNIFEIVKSRVLELETPILVALPYPKFFVDLINLILLKGSVINSNFSESELSIIITLNFFRICRFLLINASLLYVTIINVKSS